MRPRPRSQLTQTPQHSEYRVLTEFRRLFDGKVYKHRASNQGDFVAMHLYEDLVAVQRSSKLMDAAIFHKDRVLNVQNRRRGIEARRGDGTFGEIIPGGDGNLRRGLCGRTGPHRNGGARRRNKNTGKGHD